MNSFIVDEVDQSIIILCYR